MYIKPEKQAEQTTVLDIDSHPYDENSVNDNVDSSMCFTSLMLNFLKDIVAIWICSLCNNSLFINTYICLYIFSA